MAPLTSWNRGDMDMPAVGDGEVLIRVRAASVSPLDRHFMRGEPCLIRIRAGLQRPRASANGLGADMAGSVEAAGKNVGNAAWGPERGVASSVRARVA
jgi:NADPH:quinone reductase-like Zn-dependent oxidoreductase